MIVAIDGPAATGKSTSAKLVAQKLGFTYMDTGAMYRCVTLSVLRGHISLTDEQAIKLLLKDVDIQIEMIEDALIVRLNNEDVSMLIRKPKVTSHVSAVSALPQVREHMVTIQRQIGGNHNGKLKQAYKLVDIAKNSGADFVKFQTFKTENLVTKNTKKADYQIKNTKKIQD